MKATKQYFPVVLFIMLYKVALTFESVDEILKCDHSNESYKAVLSCGTICMLYKIVRLAFEVRVANTFDLPATSLCPDLLWYITQRFVLILPLIISKVQGKDYPPCCYPL